MKYIDELGNEELKGKRVLLRLDLNVPIVAGEVLDAYRIERIIDTVDYLREKEAQTIIIAHCEGKESSTLVPMWHYLNGFFPVDFCKNYFDAEAVDKILNMKDKGVLLFENLRINPEEKANDEMFSKRLANMADLYVNDAFGAMHRKHASIVGVPKYLPHYGGFLLRQEIEHLSRIFSPSHPFVFILGGAKFDTKIPLIKKYLDSADYVFVGGALANDIFKAKGFETGISLLSEGSIDMSEIISNSKLIIPIDVTVQKPDESIEVKSPDKVEKDEYIIDMGPETVEMLKEKVFNAKTVVWNGPLGKYKKGFTDQTEEFAKILAEATTEHGVETIIGGGDTVASINTLNLNHKFSFISTGGGAMLDYLVNETLPGIEALDK